MDRQLVRLWKRPSYDGARFTFYLLYTDEQGRRRQKSLGHTDARKAERQRAQLERELRMGTVEPGSMRLSEFLDDSLERTRGQVRETTLAEYRTAMKHFIQVTGDMDYQEVKHTHGERFIQACLDNGNSPATAVKKLSGLKRLFQLAVQRAQIEKNPLVYVHRPKVPRQKIRVYTDEECTRLLRSARQRSCPTGIRWDLLVALALCTGMRRGELLNTIWPDIDFERKTIDVSPKKNTKQTWEWHIKDTEIRTLPLTEELVVLLAQHQANQPEGYPYVFVPQKRYDYIQQLRQEDRWTASRGKCTVNNFKRQFDAILANANISRAQFHDLRRTCLTRWLVNGLTEFDVMNLAGHADFETTRRFYLSVRQDLLQRARTVTANTMGADFVANLLQTPFDT